MAAHANRVQDTTTSTGTGSIVLAGSAPTGFRTFAAAFGAVSRRVRYFIVGTSEWEAGFGTFNGTTGLTRDIVESSSNSGSLVDFTAGSKDVFVDASATDIEAGSVGMTYALANATWLV